MKKLLAIVLLISALFIGACGSDSNSIEPSDPYDTDSAVELCENSGGHIVIHVDTNGNNYITCDH